MLRSWRSKDAPGRAVTRGGQHRSAGLSGCDLEQGRRLGARTGLSWRGHRGAVGGGPYHVCETSEGAACSAAACNARARGTLAWSQVTTGAKPKLLQRSRCVRGGSWLWWEGRARARCDCDAMRWNWNWGLELESGRRQGSRGTGQRTLTILCTAPGAGSYLYLRLTSGACDCDIVIITRCGVEERPGEVRAFWTRMRLGSSSSAACAISRAHGAAKRAQSRGKRQALQIGGRSARRGRRGGAAVK